MIESRIGIYKDDSAVLIAEPKLAEPIMRASWLMRAGEEHAQDVTASEQGRWLIVSSHEGDVRVQAFSFPASYEYFHLVSPGYPLQLYLARGGAGFVAFYGVSPLARVEFILAESPEPSEVFVEAVEDEPVEPEE